VGDEVSQLDRNALAGLRNRTLGFVFQSFNLLSRTTALENVELPLLYAACRRASVTRVRARRFCTWAWANACTTIPSDVGRATAAGGGGARFGHPAAPDCGDEPTGNLDSRTSVEIMALFQELGRSGITLLLVTHEADIARYASRVWSCTTAACSRTSGRQRCEPSPFPPARRFRRDPLQVLRVAVRALMRNKMRSFLTTLGVIIGVSAVIAMVAIGEGAKARVEEAFASMGSNLLVSCPARPALRGRTGDSAACPP